MIDQDETCAQYAEAFLGNLGSQLDIPFRENLKSSLLDYSLESLKVVDEYLDYVRKQLTTLTQAEYQQMVVWTGSYVGESIRRNSKTELHWVDHKDYIATPAGQSIGPKLPYTLGTHLLLVAPSGAMTMPINKVVRNLQEGPENNLYYYATGNIQLS